MSFFEVRVSYNIVFTTAIALTHAIGHVTLRPVLRAEWSDHGLICTGLLSPGSRPLE